ncbi:unnamed protein product [Symbiodinium sp. CCMP2592]|nr:unnamed protein product [Symbiodinium sp. CCMP2592]
MVSSRLRALAADLVLDEGLMLVARCGLRVFPELTVNQCFRKMRFFLHPDKCPPDQKARAEEAYKELDNLKDDLGYLSEIAIRNLRKFRRSWREEALFRELRDPRPEAASTPPPKAASSGPPPAASSSSPPPGPSASSGPPPAASSSSPPPGPSASSAPPPAPASSPPGPEDPQDDDRDEDGDPEIGPEDEKLAGWLRYEPVNVAELDRALDSDAVRRFAEYNLFEILLSLRRRVVKIQNGVGLLPVWQRESRHPPGMQGRVFCGIGRLPHPDQAGGKRKADDSKREELQAARASLIAQLPRPIQREILVLGLPDALVGRSAFAFPKLVKYFCRYKLNVVEVDLSNSFYQLLSKDLVLPGTLGDYVANREETLAQLVAGLNSFKADRENKAAKEARRRTAKTEDRKPWAEKDEPEITRPSKPLRREDAKGLMIAMGFGMSASNWCSQHLGFVPTSAGADPLLDMLAGIEEAVRRLHVLCWESLTPEARAWHRARNRGLASMAYSKYVSLERRALEALKLAAADRLVSLEHDGVAVHRDAADAVVAAATELGLEAALKETPDPLQYAAEHYPEFNWCLQATQPCAGAGHCLGHISARRVRPNGSDFADFVAALLAPDKDDMGALIRMSLKNLVRPAQKGHLNPPEPLNESGWTKSLVDEVLGLLSGQTMPALDGDKTRGKVLYSDGVVVDLATGERRMAQPSDRMSLRAEASSATWEPPVETELFAKVEAFLKTGASTLEANNEGLAVTEAFKELMVVSPLLQLVKKYGTWLQVLYLLRLFSRGVGALERLCELLYIHGPGSSGKDVLMLILLCFLGYEPWNYGLLVSGRYFVAGAKSGKESASPQLDQMRGKRFIWGSEVPEHDDLDTDFLKALCEQGGAPLTGRGLYRNPRSFRSMGVFCATSNFPPKVKQIDDDGWARRAREWQTEARFVAHPTKLTEHKADDSLKRKINSGCFHAEMNFFAFGFYNSLSEELNPGTELLPKPPQMVFLEEQNRENLRTVEKFLSEHCERAAQYNHGTAWTAFLDAVKAYLDCDRKVARTRLTSAGIKMHQANSKNVPADNTGAWKLKETA